MALLVCLPSSCLLHIAERKIRVETTLERCREPSSKFLNEYCSEPVFSQQGLFQRNLFLKGNSMHHLQRK